MPVPRSLCLYTPSTDPSGMGAHMVDLVAELAPAMDVSIMARPTEGGRRMLARACALGARTLELPRHRDPAFATAVTGFLAEHPAEVFHCHVGTGSEDWPGVRLARAAGCPVVVQTQHLPFLLSHPRKRAAFHHAVAEVDRLIAVSEGLRRTYERIGVPPERFTTIPNGVAGLDRRLGRAAARRALGIAGDRRVVLTVGRLTHMKGQEYLVDAVPGLIAGRPDVVVVLIGDGPLRHDLERRAAALGVSGSVEFLGHRPDARQLLGAADVFVLSSRHEGMPLVALEAMEAGLAVVGTRVIGTEEVVVDGGTGVLTPPADPGALGAAVAALLDDEPLRRRMGAAGRRRWLARHTRERMAAATLAVYAAALEAAAVGVGR